MAVEVAAVEWAAVVVAVAEPVAGMTGRAAGIAVAGSPGSAVSEVPVVV